MEESPVGESSSNGAIENAVGRSTALTRTLKVALESRIDTKMQSNWDVVPWMVRHAANIINWTRRDSSGKTAYHKFKGRPFNKVLAAFDESVFYLKPESLGGRKWAPRWEIGVGLGLVGTTGEYVIGTNEGIIKVRTLKPIVERAEKWNAKCISECKGTPWQPSPGIDSRNIPTHVVLPDTAIPSRPTAEEPKNLRRFSIKKEDVLKHGFSDGCPGCTAIQHILECRTRFGRLFEKENDPRLVREAGRLQDQFDAQRTTPEPQQPTPTPVEVGGAASSSTRDPLIMTSRPEELLGEEARRHAQETTNREETNR